MEEMCYDHVAQHISWMMVPPYGGGDFKTNVGNYSNGLYEVNKILICPGNHTKVEIL